jgi:hypothetical protein
MVARRTVLGLSAGVLLGATLESTAADAGAVDPGAVDAGGRPPGSATFGARPDTRGDAPHTLAASRRLERGRLRVARASFPLTHLGITWRGSNAWVRLRRAAGWGRWMAVSGCGGGPDGRGRAGAAALVVARGALGYEVTVGAAGTATITELDTHGASAAAAPAPAMPLPARRACPVPYLSRSAWGADESLRFSRGVEVWPLEHRPVQALTVHHSAGINGDPDPAATVRAIYYYQTVTLGWGDVGYHLLIDEAGRVYEGRQSGAEVAPVYGPVGADGRPQMVVAGHVLGYNPGNIGVCLLGTLSGRPATAAARDALARVLSSLSLLAGIDARATVQYRNPDTGDTRTVAAISGHRNWANTECPGDTFYPTLPALRDQVAVRRYRYGQPEFPRESRRSRSDGAPVR